MTNPSIDLNYILSCNLSSLPTDLFGVAVWVNDEKKIVHAGIFLIYNGENYLYHYTGTNVELIPYPKGHLYFFKELKFINTSILPSIINAFNKIVLKSTPQYGMFYPGSKYDNGGVYFDEKGFPEFMSCVGFCLNVLKTITLGGDFFKYTDWNSADTLPDEYVVGFLEKVKLAFPDVNIDEIKKDVRRITPLEYITGGFSPSLPVRKSFTNTHKKSVEDKILSEVA